jgi:hypothetical protein
MTTTQKSMKAKEENNTSHSIDDDAIHGNTHINEWDLKMSVGFW